MRKNHLKLEIITKKYKYNYSSTRVIRAHMQWNHDYSKLQGGYNLTSNQFKQLFTKFISGRVFEVVKAIEKK